MRKRTVRNAVQSNTYSWFQATQADVFSSLRVVMLIHLLQGEGEKSTAAPYPSLPKKNVRSAVRTLVADMKWGGIMRMSCGGSFPQNGLHFGACWFNNTHRLTYLRAEGKRIKDSLAFGSWQGIDPTSKVIFTLLSIDQRTKPRVEGVEFSSHRRRSLDRLEMQLQRCVDSNVREMDQGKSKWIYCLSNMKKD